MKHCFQLIFSCMFIVMVQDTSAQRWEALDSIDVTRRIGGAACVSGGKAYAGFGHDHNIRHPFNDVWSYDPALNRWTNLDYLDKQFRTYPFMFAAGDAIYFGGGTSDSGKTAIRSFMRFEPSTGTLTKLRNMPFRNAMGAVPLTLNDRVMILVGGCTRDSCDRFIYAYDLRHDTWTTIAENPQPGRFGYAFLLDSCIYIGMQVHNELLEPAPASMLDLRDMKWKRAPAFPGKARARVICGKIDAHRAFVGLGTRLKVTRTNHWNMSGEPQVATQRLSASFFRDIYVYDSRKRSWKALPLMDRARRSAIAFALGGYLYVGMGNVEHEAFRDFNRLKL